MYSLSKALAAFFILMTLGCASIPETELRHVYVMRHLQAGTGGDPGLTSEGSRQAQLLTQWFPKGEAPKAIFVSRYRRAQDTAAPLAAALGITPTIYDPADPESLYLAVTGRSDNVLVVGHSNTVPDIVERLGAVRPEPIGHDRFGDIWMISGPGRVETRRLETR